VLISYLAIAALAAGTWFEFERLPLRIFGLSGTLACGAISTWLVFYPAPIEMAFDLKQGDYPEGTVVAGVKWKNSMADLRVEISNKNLENYSDLDAEIETDLVIAGIGANNSFGAQCTFYAPPPGGVDFESVVGIDATGKKVTIPIIPVPDVQPIASLYRVHCDRLIAKSKIEIVLGLVSFTMVRTAALEATRLVQKQSRLGSR
jgi:hypothetical protein